MRLSITTVIALTCLGLCVCAYAQTAAPVAPASGVWGPSGSDANKTMQQGPLSGAEGLEASIADGRVQGLTTSLRFSQLVDSNVAANEGSGYAYSGAISGQFGYYTNSEHSRTMLSYDGGGTFHARASQDTEQFHAFSLSHGFDVNRWSFMLANDMNYSPQGGSGGGLPGISNIGPVIGPGQLIPSLLPNQNLLTFDNPRLSDTSVGQAQYQFSRRNSMTAVFSYGLIHFFNTSQMDSRQIGGSLGFDRKLSAFSTLAVKYSYQHFSYEALGPGMDSHSPQLVYERRFTSRLSAQFSAGPQVVSYVSAGPDGAIRQSSLLLAGSASMVYHTRDISTTFGYSRDVNGGSGLTNGARADTVSASAGRTFARNWNTAVSGGYTRTSAVAQSAKFNSRSVGAQLSRNLGRSMGISFSYTMQNQSSGGAQTVLPGYSGTHHVFGVGFDWHKQVPLR